MEQYVLFSLLSSLFLRVLNMTPPFDPRHLFSQTHPVFHTAHTLPRTPGMIRAETNEPCPKFQGSVDPVKPNELIAYMK